MDGSDFEDLLTGNLSASVRWQRSLPCPCTNAQGNADRGCLVCLGLGRVYDSFSAPFRCGLIAQTAKARAAMAQWMGPGAVGDSVLVLPASALCYTEIRDGDRVWDMRVEDRYHLVLIPGTKFALPFGYRHLEAMRKNDAGTALIAIQPPTVGANRVVEVQVTTTIGFHAPRGYEVVKDLSHVRSFGEGLPRRLSLQLLDASMRSPRAAQTLGR